MAAVRDRAAGAAKGVIGAIQARGSALQARGTELVTTGKDALRSSRHFKRVSIGFYLMQRDTLLETEVYATLRQSGISDVQAERIISEAFRSGRAKWADTVPMKVKKAIMRTTVSWEVEAE